MHLKHEMRSKVCITIKKILILKNFMYISSCTACKKLGRNEKNNEINQVLRFTSHTVVPGPADNFTFEKRNEKER